MTDQIITITGLEFTTEGRPIAHGAIIREGAVPAVISTSWTWTGSLSPTVRRIRA